MSNIYSMPFVLPNHCDQTYQVHNLSDDDLEKFHSFKVQAYMNACRAARVNGENEDLSCVRRMPIELWRNIFKYLTMKDIVNFVTTRRWGDFFELNNIRNRYIRIHDLEGLTAFQNSLDECLTHHKSRQLLLIETLEYPLGLRHIPFWLPKSLEDPFRGGDTLSWVPKLIESNVAKVKTLLLRGPNCDFTSIVKMICDQRYKRSEELEVLHIEGYEIQLSQLIDILSSSPALKSFTLKYCSVHIDIDIDVTLGKVEFSSIEKLHVSRMSNQDLLRLMKRMPNLMDIKIEDVTIANVSEVPGGYFFKATSLDMYDVSFTNQADQKFVTLFPNLEKLSLTYNPTNYDNELFNDVSQFELSQWPINVFPFLQSFNVSWTNITAVDLKHLVRVMPELTALNLEYCRNIDDDEFLNIKVMLPQNLKELDFFRTENIRVVSEVLKQLPNLTRLSLNPHWEYAEGDLSSLEAGSCPQMKHLVIPLNIISYENLFYLLRACPNLVTFELWLECYSESDVPPFSADEAMYFPFLKEGSLPALERIIFKECILPNHVLFSILKAAPNLREIPTSENKEFYLPLSKDDIDFLKGLCFLSAKEYKAAVNYIDTLRSNIEPQIIKFIDVQIKVYKDAIALQELEKSLKRPVEEAQDSEPKRIRKDAE